MYIFVSNVRTGNSLLHGGGVQSWGGALTLTDKGP